MNTKRRRDWLAEAAIWISRLKHSFIKVGKIVALNLGSFFGRKRVNLQRCWKFQTSEGWFMKFVKR